MNNFMSPMLVDQMLQADWQNQSQQPQGSQYPSMPNSYGLGSQQTQPTQQTQAQTQMQPNSSSKGYNPWDLGGGVSGAR